MEPVSKTQVEELIVKHRNWQLENDVLTGNFSFDSYDEVKKFVVKVMEIADTQNHHPTVSFGYNFVRVETTTHDAGNKITEKDLRLAESVGQM